MIPKFRAWYGAEMYDEPVIHNGEFYLDWRDFIDGDTYDGAVLMQSTGLFDSRSEPVEIYKDDIVKRTSLIPGGSDMIGVVKMLEGCWVIDDGKQAVPLWTEVDENIVLGNIHEHPELVEMKVIK